MYRRRYVALVGAGLLAGCGDGDDATPTPTSTPTTDAPTATETATETSTEALTGEERAAAEMDAAVEIIGQAHQVYLDQADGDAATLLEVGAAPAGFNIGRIQTICNQAQERLDAASESTVTHQRPRLRRLRSAATWLSGAAEVQEAIATVAEALDRAGRTAAGGADYATVASHFRTARGNVDTVDELYSALESPRPNAFEEIDDIDGDDVDAKHQQFGRELSGLRTLVGRIDRVVGEAEAGDDGEIGGAIGTLQSAQAAYDAGEYDSAENDASSAQSEFRNLELLDDDVGPDNLQPLFEQFESAVNALRDRAATLSDDADEQQ